VVLSKLPSGIAKRFQKFGDSWILILDSHLGPRHAHFAQPGTEGTLPGNKRCPIGCAALFPIRVRKPYAFVSDPIDIWHFVSHQAVTVAIQVTNAMSSPQMTSIFGFFSVISLTPQDL
jgi:hypothetical protein